MSQEAPTARFKELFFKMKNNVRRLRLTSSYLVGIILCVYLTTATLYISAQTRLGFYLVVRRVSVYTIVPFDEFYILVLAASSMILALNTLIKWRSLSWKMRALSLVILLSFTMMLASSIIAKIALYSIGLIAGILLLYTYGDVYKGFTFTWLALIILSSSSLILGVIGVKSTILFNTPLYIISVLQPVSVYLLLISLCFSAITLFLSLLRAKSASFEAGNPRSEYYYLIMAMILSIILYATPYIVAVNPRGMIATTDILVYVNLLNEMIKSSNPLEAALTLRSGDRFLYMLLIYYLMKFTGLDPWTISTISGWMWAPFLTFSTWYMTRQLYGYNVARHVAFLTPLSTQAFGFIYGGFQANHFNLALIFLAVGLLKSEKFTRQVLGSMLILVSIGVHAWSWIHIVPAILLWTIMELVKKKSRANALRFLTLSTAIAAALLFVSSTVKSYEFIVEQALLLVSKYTLNKPLMEKINGISLALSIYVWGALCNPLIKIMSIAGQTLRLSIRDHNPLDYLFIATLIGLYAFSPQIDMISRLILDIPLHVFVGLFLSNSSRETRILVYSTLIYNSIYLALNAPP